MAEEKDILDQLKRITESELFVRSAVNVALLKLLVQSTLEGVKLKETSIGPEIFGRSYDPLKNDTKVRVYVHNLRKRLAEYYATVGKNDLWLFEVEKGQYTVQFIRKTTQKKRSSAIRQTAIITLAIGFVGLITALFVWFQSTRKIPFWQTYLDGQFPVSVLIGDHFMIESAIPMEGTGLVRAFNINSEADFAAYIHDHPEEAGKISPSRYTYVTKMGPYCTKMLGDLFSEKDLPYQLMLNSEWDKSKISSENVVYIGQFKTMGFLRNLYNENNKRIRLDGGPVTITDAAGVPQQRYISNNGHEMIDYTVVSQIRGPGRNLITMFLSDNDMGVIRVMNYFTNPDSLASFYLKHQLENRPFTALFKVSGWDRTGYNMSLQELDVRNE